MASKGGEKKKVIANVMNKGGVGKTTILVNMAALYAKNHPKRQVLIIDCDPQGNATINMGFFPDKFRNHVGHILLGEKEIKDIAVQVNRHRDIANLYLVPANFAHNQTAYSIIGDIAKYSPPLMLLDAAIKRDDFFNTIFIDTPPSLELITGNAIMAADQLMIPFELEQFSIFGIENVLATIITLKQTEDLSKMILAAIPCKVNLQTTLHNQVLSDVEGYLKNRGIYLSQNMLSVSTKYAASYTLDAMPLVLKHPRSKPALEMVDLYKELTKRGM